MSDASTAQDTARFLAYIINLIMAGKSVFLRYASTNFHQHCTDCNLHVDQPVMGGLRAQFKRFGFGTCQAVVSTVRGTKGYGSPKINTELSHVDVQ